MDLKKIGGILAKATEFVSIFGLFAKTTKTTKDDVIVARIDDSLIQIAGITQLIEGANANLTSPLGGEQKALMTAPAVAQIVMRSMALQGKKLNPAKQDKWIATLPKVGGAVADLVDCFEDD